MLVGRVIRYFYFRQESGLLYRTTYSLEKSHEDIIILGPSTANHHYIPSMFEENLKMTCYNTGRDGNGIYFNLAIQKGILQRYRPQILILDIRPEILTEESLDMQRLSNLLPYYNDHPEIRSIVLLRSENERIKLFSQIYPFNSLLLTILAGNLEFNKNRKADYKGYVPLYKTMDYKVNDTISELVNYDTNKIKALETFIENAKFNGSRVIMIKSPSYIYYKNEDKDIINEISIKYNVPYWKYFNDTAFIYHPELFMDRSHLNNNGAIKFSSIIIKKMKEEILVLGD